VAPRCSASSGVPSRERPGPGLQELLRGLRQLPAVPQARPARQLLRYPDSKQFRAEPGRLFLPKAGWVEWVRYQPIEGRPKTATVSREADCRYVSVQCKLEVRESRPNLKPAVGIDIGIAKPLVLSTGEVIQLPRTTGKERHKLALLQRKPAGKTKDSRNQAKRGWPRHGSSRSWHGGARMPRTGRRRRYPGTTA
jgi:transposase